MTTVDGAFLGVAPTVDGKPAGVGGDGRKPSNLVYVFTEDDFGTFVGDAVELQDNTIYRIMAPFTLSSGGLVLPVGSNIEIQGTGQNINSITYTNANSPFLSSSGSAFFKMTDFTVNFASPTQQLFDLGGNGAGPLLWEDMVFVGVANSGMGSIAGYLTCTVENTAFVGAPTWSGELVFADTDLYCGVCGFFNAVSSGGALIAVESTTRHVFEFINCRVLPLAGESAWRISSTTQDAATRVVVRDAITNGSGVLFDTTGIDECDPRVTSTNNFGRASSSVSGEGNFTGNVSNTIIPAIDALVLHASTNSWTFTEENRTQGNLQGLVEITALEPVKVILDGSVLLNPTGGNRFLGAVYVQIGTEAIPVTFDAAADTFSATGLSDGDAVVLINSGGTLPGGLLATHVYYVVNTNQLSYTPGGAAINITSNGSGNTFDRATLHGSRESEEIGSSVPRNVIVQGLALMAAPGDKFGIYIFNSSSTTNVLAAGGYTRTSG